MTTKEILPLPASTYQLLLDAARAWPDGIATQWIPDPADHTRCLDWTYAELAGTATRIANALTTLGVKRGDAVTLSAPTPPCCTPPPWPRRPPGSPPRSTRRCPASGSPS